MPAQESTVDTAMEAMPQNINDRLTESVEKFYRDELGQSPARKVCGWSTLDVLSRFKTYKEDEYEAWEKRRQAYENRHEEEKRQREAERERNKPGFFGSLGNLFGDAARGIGHALSSPTKPEQLSDEEALQDINLVQRYLRSVTQPGMKPLNLPPTVSRALKELNKNSLQNTVVYQYLLSEWGRRGVEEIASVGNDQIYREIANNHSYNIITEEEQARRKDIKIILQYLRQINNQHRGNNRRR